MHSQNKYLLLDLPTFEHLKSIRVHLALTKFAVTLANSGVSKHNTLVPRSRSLYVWLYRASYEVSCMSHMGRLQRSMDHKEYLYAQTHSELAQIQLLAVFHWYTSLATVRTVSAETKCSECYINGNWTGNMWLMCGRCDCLHSPLKMMTAVCGRNAWYIIFKELRTKSFKDRQPLEVFFYIRGI